MMACPSLLGETDRGRCPRPDIPTDGCVFDAVQGLT